MNLSSATKIYVGSQEVSKVVNQLTDIFTSAPGGGGSGPDLLVYESDGITQIGDFTGQTTPVVGSSSTYDVFNPTYLKEGSAVTSISFTNIAEWGYAFGLNTADLDGSSLTSLSFQSVGTLGEFYFNDSTGMTNVDTISFNSYAGYYHCYVTDTSGLASLTTLNFSYAGYQSGVIITDTSGLGNLTSCSFSYAGYFGLDVSVSVIDTVNVMPEAAALVLLEGIYNNISSGLTSGGTIDIKVDGDSSLSTVISNLGGAGWTVTVTVA